MPRRILKGIVVSNSAHKTIIVKVERMKKHPLYKKFIRRSKRFAAHDEDNQAQLGDSVFIRQCRPFSKRKHWELIASDNIKTADNQQEVRQHDSG